MTEPNLTPTGLLSAATELLNADGYTRVDESYLTDWPRKVCRVFEDKYGIAAVCVLDTFNQLATNWIDLQDKLVNLMTKYIDQGEAKSWEGYLVLMTPAVPDRSQRVEAANIRYNTQRLRKLLATGDELFGVQSVETALLPLLPFKSIADLNRQESVLDMLPELLTAREIPQEVTRTVVKSFLGAEPIMERLHSVLKSS